MKNDILSSCVAFSGNIIWKMPTIFIAAIMMIIISQNLRNSLLSENETANRMRTINTKARYALSLFWLTKVAPLTATKHASRMLPMDFSFLLNMKNDMPIGIRTTMKLEYHEDCPSVDRNLYL